MGAERDLGWELVNALGVNLVFPESFLRVLRQSGDPSVLDYRPVSLQHSTEVDVVIRQPNGKTENRKVLKADKYTRNVTEEYLKEEGDGAFLNNAGSQNIPKLRAEVRRLHGLPNGDEFWLKAFKHDRESFMGSEEGSSIYGDWHLLAAASAMSSHNPEVAQEAEQWVAFYLKMERTFEFNGQILWPGQRSGGHLPLSGLREWVYAQANGQRATSTGDIVRAVNWCRQAGVGLNFRWERFATMALISNLYQANRAANSMTLPDLQKRGHCNPIHVQRSSDSLVVWLGDGASGFACSNSNTPPVVAAIGWPDGSVDWIPRNGGNHTRQKFDHCHVRREGNFLVYESDLSPSERIPVPAPTSNSTQFTIG